SGVELSEAEIAAGLSAVSWPARLQPITSGPLFEMLPAGATLFLDGGHNPHAAEMLARHFAGQKIYLITGMMENRNPADFLAPLAGVVERMAAVPIPGEAAHAPSSLVAAARGLAIPATAFDSPRHALQQVGEGETVLIAGSLYLAGQVLRVSGLAPE
ncbi:MAG: bifunctional folylpolyglutamate synthase/dihydrofolate synthase, partial [Alphaproteobacteria bacterium]|nr:bifunctional folylpolyglutamate synthase/dihydrofolate synthase [Alphaproteobacteria bacterium]